MELCCSIFNILPIVVWSIVCIFVLCLLSSSFSASYYYFDIFTVVSFHQYSCYSYNCNIVENNGKDLQYYLKMQCNENVDIKFSAHDVFLE